MIRKFRPCVNEQVSELLGQGAGLRSILGAKLTVQYGPPPLIRCVETHMRLCFLSSSWHRLPPTNMSLLAVFFPCC